MNITEICSGIYYAGVNNRSADLFEEMWPVPAGVSYNSYIVVGEKVALIDTVHITKCAAFLAKVKAIIGSKPIDYLIINHMEPDHSGAIGLIKQQYPDITIIGNAKTAEMLKGYHGIQEGVQIVKDKDVIDLGGGQILKFFLTPMVHWPETMMTYVSKEQVLFSGDAFGCFGALRGAVVDKDMDTSDYIPEMYRYYASIVAKYGTMVGNAIKKLSTLPVSYICSTHGPVWSERAGEVIALYGRMARWESEPGVVIAYGSMYGNTEEAAETVAEELSAQGVKNIRLYNLSHTNYSYILSDVMRFKSIVIGAPTYNNGLFPPAEQLLRALAMRDVKNRTLSYFGSCTWAMAATKRIATEIEGLKTELVGTPVEIKQSPNEDAIEALRQLARDIAAQQ